MSKENITAVKIRVLKAAKKKLETFSIYSSLGICCALLYVGHGENYDVSFTLRKYVARELGEHAYLTEWLRAKNLPCDAHSVRKARIAWIDWMIASLEGKN